MTRKRSVEGDQIYGFVASTGFFVSGVSAVAGVLLLGYQCFKWLKHGVWLGYSGTDGFRYLGADPEDVTWIGLRKILLYFTDLPLAFWLIFGPVGVTIAVLLALDDDLKQP